MSSRFHYYSIRLIYYMALALKVDTSAAEMCFRSQLNFTQLHYKYMHVSWPVPT